MDEGTCVGCGLPIVFLGPRGIWRTANPKTTRAPYVCASKPDGNHSPEETLLYRAEDEPCERGTVGCSVAHVTGDEPCQPW